ncbi:hypothetical protein J6590_040706 [Homalodisca vitripennis]|nr:hypothetical protein J6590_040706 [Homalodisca vitripennis]
MFKIIRRGPPRFIAASAVLLTVLLCIYYVNFSGAPNLGPGGPGLEPLPLVEVKRDNVQEPEDNEVPGARSPPAQETTTAPPEPASVVSPETCAVTYMAEADVDTVEQFQKFNFQHGAHCDRPVPPQPGPVAVGGFPFDCVYFDFTKRPGRSQWAPCFRGEAFAEEYNIPAAITRDDRHHYPLISGEVCSISTGPPHPPPSQPTQHLVRVYARVQGPRCGSYSLLFLQCSGSSCLSKHTLPLPPPGHSLPVQL